MTQLGTEKTSSQTCSKVNILATLPITPFNSLTRPAHTLENNPHYLRYVARSSLLSLVSCMYRTTRLCQMYKNTHDLIIFNSGSTEDEAKRLQKTPRHTSYAEETHSLSHRQQRKRGRCCQFRHPHPARKTPKQPEETLRLPGDPKAYFWEIYSNAAVI